MFFDTHNHFDDPAFDGDRLCIVQQAIDVGIQQMVMTGITAQTFGRMVKVQFEVNQATQQVLKQSKNIKEQGNSENFLPFLIHLAFGLHPLFINHHQDSDLALLETYVQKYPVIALGEVGLDTFTPEMKIEANYVKQKHFFHSQLDLAVKYQLPVLLHIRKAHADSLQILKQHKYNAHQLGGIAHSFSGGEQEAKAFVNMGFKLGITGQVCNPNAKKLHKAIIEAVSEYGLNCLVVETDCPDMTPFNLRKTHTPNHQHKTVENSKSLRNTPNNLIYVVDAISKLLQVDKQQLSRQLWKNSFEALNLEYVDSSYVNLESALNK